MSDYPPGTVAMITAANRREHYRAYFDGNTWREYGANMFCVVQPTDVRPLVVLDLPNGALAGWPVLIDALRYAREKTGYRMTFDGLIDQIEAQTCPPKPEEPTGLGAVVRDREGRTWVLFGNDCWIKSVPNAGLEQHPYADIDAVEVLSEGVTDA